MINTFVHLIIQKIKKIFRLSNTARKIFCIARIFDATLPHFTNGRAIALPAPLSPTSMRTKTAKFQKDTIIIIKRNTTNNLIALYR